MADLNDDIKKYLRGELTPSEMHALEKKALNDPFLEEALEGSMQLDADAFDSDLKNLRSSLGNRVSAKRGKVVSLWVWSARIAAGLALIAISTFIIVKLTDNRAENDLALQQQESPTKDHNAEATTDSTTLNGDITAESRSQASESEASPVEQPNKVVEESKPAANAAGAPPSETAAEKPLAEIQVADEQLAKTTDRVAEQQPQAVVSTEAEEGAAARKKADADATTLTEDDKRQRVASAPAEKAKGFSSINVSKVIRGRVESVDGVGLPGVNVMIKNTNIGTVTDASGNYQLSVTQNDPSLVFSFIGFTSTEIAANDKTQVNVQLNEDVSQLSEVVVVGYGGEQKTDDAPETLELANPYGGRRAYKQYLEKNMQYPEQALAQNIEGKVTIQFTVESSGQLSDFKVIKGIGHGCDEEVMRLVKAGPKWNPTRRNTESLRDKVKVRMKFTLPKK